MRDEHLVDQRREREAGGHREDRSDEPLELLQRHDVTSATASEGEDTDSSGMAATTCSRISCGSPVPSWNRTSSGSEPSDSVEGISNATTALSSGACEKNSGAAAIDSPVTVSSRGSTS